MPINVQTTVQSVAIDANLETNLKNICDAEGLADRRLTAAFVVTAGANSRVVLIFQHG